MANPALFAACPNCPACWPNRRDFLDRAEFELIGYTADLDHPSNGRLHFVHTAPGCYAPFTLPVGPFLTLLEAASPIAGLRGAEACSGLCNDPFCLEPCYNECRLAPVRRLFAKLADAALVAGMMRQRTG